MLNACQSATPCDTDEECAAEPNHACFEYLVCLSCDHEDAEDFWCKE